MKYSGSILSYWLFEDCFVQNHCHIALWDNSSEAVSATTPSKLSILHFKLKTVPDRVLFVFADICATHLARIEEAEAVFFDPGELQETDVFGHLLHHWPPSKPCALYARRAAFREMAAVKSFFRKDLIVECQCVAVHHDMVCRLEMDACVL